jgi:hypothetical protein
MYKKFKETTNKNNQFVLLSNFINDILESPIKDVCVKYIQNFT